MFASITERCQDGQQKANKQKQRKTTVFIVGVQTISYSNITLVYAVPNSIFLARTFLYRPKALLNAIATCMTKFLQPRFSIVLYVAVCAGFPSSPVSSRVRLSYFTDVYLSALLNDGLGAAAIVKQHTKVER